MGKWNFIPQFKLKHVIVWSALFLATVSPPAHALQDQKSPQPPCEFWMGFLNAESFSADDRDLQAPAQLTAKVQNLAKGISSLNNSRGVQVMGLAEVSTAELLERLASTDPLKKQYFKYNRVSGQPDLRGMDVGFLSQFPLIEVKAHRYWDSDEPIWTRGGRDRQVEPTPDITRVILEATLESPDGVQLHFFVNHWPKQTNDPKDFRSRDKETIRRWEASQFLWSRIKNIFETEGANARIVAVGDFNSAPNSVEVVEGLHVSSMTNDNINDGKPRLFNLAELLIPYQNALNKFNRLNPNPTREQWQKFVESTKNLPMTQPGTHYYAHDDAWDTFDQVIISSGMMQLYIPDSYQVTNWYPFADPAGFPKPFNPNTGKGISHHLGFQLGFRTR